MGILFLCVKPIETKGVLEEIKGHLQPDAHLVSIVGSYSLSMLENFFPGKISIAVPSTAGESGEGLCLLCHNNQVQPQDAKTLEKLFGSIGMIKTLPESGLDAISTITSCGPGLFSAMFQEFIRAGIRQSGLAEVDVEEMAARTILGTIKLNLEKKTSFEQVIQRTATKGGTTQEGIDVMRQGLPPVFDRVFRAIQKKREQRAKNLQT